MLTWKLEGEHTEFLLMLGFQLAGELLNTSQESLIYFTLPAEFIFEVLSLIDALQRGPQELILSLRVLNDFLRWKVG
jgi:hypothetical protein